MSNSNFDPMSFLHLIHDTIHQYTIIIPGGHNKYGGYHDYIVEYNPEEDTMTIVGHMTTARAYHAVSVVPAEDYLQWCQ